MIGASAHERGSGFHLDSVGNRTQRVDQQGTHSYAYDNLYRLTSVTYPGPSTTSYAFDAFGNRTSKTDAGGTTAYSYDDADRITAVTPPSPASAISYTWDNNGNLTNRGSDSFSWDYEDRMASATVNSVTTSFGYRGDGLRNSRTSGGNTTTFTWDIAGGLPVVLDDGSQYVYGAGLTAMKQSGNWFYYLADGLGSTMAIVDSAGAVQKSYTYDVYGKPTATGSLANEFDFAGQQTDATGLQYLRARYMDPETGTFISRDPAAALPMWVESPTAYGSGSPSNASDPWGLYPSPGGGRANSAEKRWCARPWRAKQCYDALMLAHRADGVARAMFPSSNLHNDEADAFHHCLWAGLLTFQFGCGTAKGFLDRHESGDNNPPGEAIMDLHNNAVGMGLAEKLADSGSREQRLIRACLDAIESGRLMTSPWPVVGSAPVLGEGP